MSVISIVAIYLAFCLLIFIMVAIGRKIEIGTVDVDDFLQAIIFSMTPIINILLLAVAITIISRTLWEKTSKWYEGVKYNRVW